MIARNGDLTKSINNHKLILISVLAFITIILFSNPCFAWYEVKPTNNEFTSNLNGWTTYISGYAPVVKSEWYNDGSPTAGCARIEVPAGYGVADCYIEQTFDFKDAQYLTFEEKTLSAPGGQVGIYIYIDDFTKANWVAYEAVHASWLSHNITIPVGKRSGIHTLRFREWGSNSYPAKNLIDNIVLKTGTPTDINVSLYPYLPPFEYGKSCRYYADIKNANLTDIFSLDIYGKNTTNYTLLNTVNVTSDQGYAGYPFDFTAPSLSDEYESVYVVLRKGDTVYNNSTTILVGDKTNYFGWVPAVIGYDETSTLHYSYNYSGKYYDDTAPYQIRLVDYWDPESFFRRTYALNTVVVDNLNNVSGGTYSFTAPNTSYMYYEIKNGKYTGNNYTKYPKEYRKYELIRNRWTSLDEYVFGNGLMSSTLIIDPSKSTPVLPNYIPQKNPEEQADVTPDNPELPPEYKPPVYPHPSNPSEEHEDSGNEEIDNPDFDPAYQPNTTYNPDTHTWTYDNTSAYNGTDGYFPVDIPGNTSPNTSRFQGFYTFVDDVYSPVNKTVLGFLGFVLSPIISISGYINTTSQYFNDASEDLADNNVLTEIFSPIFNALPPEFIALMVFSLTLTILSLILKGR